MYLNRVEVRHFRNLTSVSLSPTEGINILEGKNASGKTSFLEAIYMLGLARSFRTIKTKQLIQNGQSDLVIFAQLSNHTQRHRLGLQRFLDNRTLLRLDGSNLQSRTELVQLLPVQLVTPESVSLLSGPPSERRQYLDWILFHVEPNFHEHWQRYHRALKQRNALLRDNRTRELPFWTEQLVKDGSVLTDFRAEIITQVEQYLEHYLSILLPDNPVTMHYRQGWKSGQDLYSSIGAAEETDIRNKYTSVGPHRADLLFLTEQQRVVEVFSRGQQKLMLCALKLAQLEYIKAKTSKTSIVLIDDLPAELDADHRALLLEQLHGLKSQVFVTTTDRSHLDYSTWKDVKVFHVEHGNIQEVV